MILAAFLHNFIKLLTKMAEDEVGMLLGVHGEIKKLEKTVRGIQCVLSDAERKQAESSAIERWLLQLKDVMYDADDLMDMCQINAEERCARYSTYHPSSKFRCGINMLSCFRNPIFAHKIGTKIKELNSRLDEISKERSILGLTELQAVVKPSNILHQHSEFSRKTDPQIVLADIVGDKIEEDTTLLVKLLTTEKKVGEENISAVAIVGMPGIGKTTLAKKVFNDPEIQREFPLKLWYCVSKDLKGVELLKCIIREAGGDHGVAEDRAELVPMLARLVRDKKFFLILDDVWPESQEVWIGLLRDAMIGGARGSRLLVTTRDDRVARFIQATTSHHVQRLSDMDAWSLLVKQVALNEIERENLKDIGLELVRKCDGLPLAIKAIGGVLRVRGPNIIEWQTISKSTLWSLVDLPNNFPRAFFLSYEDLPSNLRQCFIFCSLYPEDFEIFRTDLVYLWLAEGFLCDEGDLSFYELGMEYYKELIMRNLLEVHERFYDQWVCKMHDLMRSFAEYVRDNDSLTMREGELSHRYESLLKLRRLSVEKIEVGSNLDFLNKDKSLRTLLLINNLLGDVLFKVLPSFSHLRIVVLSHSNISSLSDSFCALVQLRYLDLFRTNLITLPNSIGNLRKLKYLNIGECRQLSHVPSSIVDLLELRFLCFHKTKSEVFPVGLRRLTKLVQLLGFKPNNDRSKGHSSLEDLGTLSQLSRLDLYSLEKASDITIAKEANLKAKFHLKDLTFAYTPNRGCQVSKSIEEKQIAEDVLNVLSPPLSLEILRIIGYLGYHLPNWLHVWTFPSELKYLRFLKISECECFSQLPPLGQLPNLDYLRIEGAISVQKIGREFFLNGSEDRITSGTHYSPILPFPLLTNLIFVGMSHWAEWLWEKNQPAMPKLKELSITNCPKLSSLPKGLSHHATSLEYLTITTAERIKYVEDLQTVRDIRVHDNPNLERVSNLPNLSFILIGNCPNLMVVENLKPRHRMELVDYEMVTLPEYLRKVEPKKLTIRCAKELLLEITILGVGSPEWQKFEHIPVVKIHTYDESLYAAYCKTPFSFTTNIC
ncbi:hypothetical protein LUZ63_013144 [Rhynchospora breviuscula]|uniref:Disease resistance protein RGA3 n=1 Tax=Rhynchospora breviuscula TaxID=2022672 RepID=A0A9Q0C824_9POAL|nr:hypothetical protein LUZ63_013144 [Rhynchospora breviuscula]